MKGDRDTNAFSKKHGLFPAHSARLKPFLAELRAFSFPVSGLPVVIAVAAVRPVPQWRLGLLAAELAAVLLLHALGNMLNDYFDFAAGADRPGPDDDSRPGRLLVRGILTPAQVRTECVLVSLPLAVAAAIILAACGPFVLVFAAVGLAGAWAYTAPPFRLKYRALGELTIFVVFGPALMLGAAFVQTGRLEPAALLLSLPVGLATTAVLAGNNLRDWEEDRGGGVRTLTHVWGTRAQLWFYVALLVAAFLISAGIGAAYSGRLAWLVAAPLAAVPLAPTIRSLFAERRVPDLDERTAKAVSGLYLFMIAVLIWNGGLGGGPS
ncbi:MAG: prenyltransferase [Kiritimatiellaeota bacterium]|nr:prenyltransferase [Kiritimatiellota bacterium]